jgi:hypothetical protein
LISQSLGCSNDCGRKANPENDPLKFTLGLCHIPSRAIHPTPSLAVRLHVLCGSGRLLSLSSGPGGWICISYRKRTASSAP